MSEFIAKDASKLAVEAMVKRGARTLREAARREPELADLLVKGAEKLALEEPRLAPVLGALVKVLR